MTPGIDVQTADAPAQANAAEVALVYALHQLGKPYRWGATGPDTYDCSGLVVASYAAGGVHDVPRTTYTMLAKLSKVVSRNLSLCAPGDILFPHAGHCGLYLGNNKMVEAPHTGTVVRVRAVTNADAWQVRRVASAQTTMTTVTVGWRDALGFVWQFSPLNPEHYIPHIPDIPGVGGGQSLPGPGSVAGGIAGPIVDELLQRIPGLNSIGELIKVVTTYARIGAWMSDPANWLRIAEFGAGALLVLLALISWEKVKTGVKQAASAAATAKGV